MVVVWKTFSFRSIVVIYCRVSSSDNKSNLGIAEQRLLGFRAAKVYTVSLVIKSEAEDYGN